MAAIRRMDLADLIAFILIVAAAAGVRVWYLSTAADNSTTSGPIRVQDARSPATSGTQPRGRETATDLDVLVANLTTDNRFATRPPFARGEEETAHVAPGYPYFLSLLERLTGDADKTDQLARWIQAGLGALTAGLYYVIALVSFRSRIVAVFTGLFCVVHPFWIVNTATIDDGTLATFLLAFALFFGTRGGMAGGPLTSLLFGLSLAALALVRAALLPFAIVGLLWFLVRSRFLSRGWMCAILAFLGFVIGCTPWTLRNWQKFQEPVPIVNTFYLHLWIGNNPHATGGPMNEEQMGGSLIELRGRKDVTHPSKQIATATGQSDRYGVLGVEVLDEIQIDPAATVRRRIGAALSFLSGQEFLRHAESWSNDSLMTTPGRFEPLPAWLGENLALIFLSATLLMLAFGVLGWRWTFAWRRESRLLALAAICIPLPYILTHAESFFGPRLPLDGVLLTFAAYALSCLIPGVGASLFGGPEAAEDEQAVGRRLQEDRPHVRL